MEMPFGVFISTQLAEGFSVEMTAFAVLELLVCLVK